MAVLPDATLRVKTTWEGFEDSPMADQIAVLEKIAESLKEISSELRIVRVERTEEKRKRQIEAIKNRALSDDPRIGGRAE